MANMVPAIIDNDPQNARPASAQEDPDHEGLFKLSHLPYSWHGKPMTVVGQDGQTYHGTADLHGAVDRVDLDGSCGVLCVIDSLYLNSGIATLIVHA